MNSTPKIAVITAASIGLMLTQSSSLRAENESSSAPERATEIAAPIDLDEEVLYSALPDEVLMNSGVTFIPSEIYHPPVARPSVVAPRPGPSSCGAGTRWNGAQCVAR
jgi:hypothetical protein